MARAKKTEKVEEVKEAVQEATASGHSVTAHDFDIIRGPIHTEKTQSLSTNDNAIVLEVAVGANKEEIKKAVEAIFGVKVDKVNTINIRKKAKKVGRYSGFTHRYKKAIVYVNKASDLAEIAKKAHE